MCDQSQPPPKRARVQNFSQNERSLLLELLGKYKDVIENKKTDATTNQIKYKAWKSLADEFNSMSSDCTRTAAQLRCCWDNLKRKPKKRPAGLFGKESSSPIEQIPPPITECLVEAIISPADNHSDDFDSDVKAEVESVGNSVSESEMYAEEPVASTSNINDIDPWSSWTFQDLQTPFNPMRPNRTQDWAKRRRPQKGNNGPAALVKEKIKLVKIMQHTAVKEARVRLAILEEQLVQEKLKSEKLRQTK